MSAVTGVLVSVKPLEGTVDWFGKVVGALKLGARSYIAVAATAGLLLFLPQSVLHAIQADSLRDRYPPWIAVVFALTSIMSLTFGVSWIGEKYRERSRKRKWKAQSQRTLQMLGEDEKRVLAWYISNRRQSRMWPPEEGAAASLRQKGVLAITSPVGSIVDGFMYTIQPWAWESLLDHPELLARDHSVPFPEPQRPWWKWGE